MAKFKPCNEDQLVMLPISLQDQLVPGTLEHTISELVDKHIDLSVFDERYNNDETGATAIHPKILLKIILLAYARGMISSRQVERERQKKRERRFQLQVERLNEFLKAREPKLGSDGKEIQSNVIDNESVKTPTSHGVLQGYNAQAFVDSRHQVILAAETFSSQDHENLAPMLAGAKKNLHDIGKEETYFEGKQLTADSNYHSFNNLTLCKEEKIDAYIPDIQFRKRDPRFADQERFQDGLHGKQRPDAKPGLFTAYDFSFDPSKPVYLCPQGKELTCHARNRTNRYRTYDIYHARPEDCAACPLKARCLSKPSTSRRYLSVPVVTQEPNLIAAMKAKIDTQQGKQIYARRLGIVEPVFANICVQKRMNRFTLRSKLKVDVQWTRTRFALVHNIGKIHTFGAIHRPLADQYTRRTTFHARN